MIAVLLPTYNQAAFLEDALAGLDAQTRRDFELIACDDGSTDGTADILAKHGVRTVTHPSNQGTAAATNSAAAQVGEDARYVTWVSSDNVMHPRWLECLARELDARPELGAVYSQYHRCQSGGGKTTRRIESPGPYNPKRLISGDECYFGPSFLVRREVWPEHRGGTAHDYDSWARTEEACFARGLTMACVYDVLCDYHRGDWNTAVRYPERYDAPRWRAEALERRKLTRNWLGDLVADHVLPTDDVLDLGCGIMPATGGRLAVRRHVGVDSFQPYLDRIGPPSVLANLPDGLDGFADGSFNVVLLLDVVEHLEKPAALRLIGEAERIARHTVIVFTPDGFVPQDGWGAWGMAENPAQQHRCGFTFDELTAMGYACTRHPNGTQQQGPIVSVLGVKRA